MAREKVLLGGAQSSSKSLTLVLMAYQYPNSRIVIFDPDDGIKKIVEGDLGIKVEQIPNLLLIPVYADLKLMLDMYNAIKTGLTLNDWLCFDMLGRLWDMTQQYYSIRVFGQDPIEHLLKLREQSSKVGFGGFDGLQDWSLIKRIHNELLLDDACIASQFNVMATTSLVAYLPVEKQPNDGTEGLIAQKFKVKLEGEKHNPYRFDTIALMYRNTNNQFKFRLVKDRGRAFNPDMEFDFTNQQLMVVPQPGVPKQPVNPLLLKSFWSEYRKYRGI